MILTKGRILSILRLLQRRWQYASFSMFWDREDVYARRGKNGGYFPQCDNRRDAKLCPKQRGEKLFCDVCENKKWTKLDVIENVLHQKCMEIQKLSGMGLVACSSGK